jgi:hypothetical protein
MSKEIMGEMGGKYRLIVEIQVLSPRKTYDTSIIGIYCWYNTFLVRILLSCLTNETL